MSEPKDIESRDMKSSDLTLTLFILAVVLIIRGKHVSMIKDIAIKGIVDMVIFVSGSAVSLSWYGDRCSLIIVIG